MRGATSGLLTLQNIVKDKFAASYGRSTVKKLSASGASPVPLTASGLC